MVVYATVFVSESLAVFVSVSLAVFVYAAFVLGLSTKCVLLRSSAHASCPDVYASHRYGVTFASSIGCK